MAETHTVSADALVRKVLADEHGDLVREAVSFLCHQSMEAEVAAQIGAGYGERARRRASRLPPLRIRRGEPRSGGQDYGLFRF